MELKQRKISVIIPVYNVEPYLRKCLDSVMNQTYKNLEIITVDDGSTDRSGGICEEYGKKDPRFVVIHQKNQGLSAARNAGLRVMTGDFVGFLDSDDWIDLDYYEFLLRKQMETGADMVQVSYYEIFGDKTYVRHIDAGCYCPKEAITRLEHGGVYGYMVTQIYRRKLWDGVEFPHDRYPCEDARTIYKLFLRAEKIACVDAAKYHYARRGDSLTGSKWIGMEVFFSRYERYMNCRQLEEKGKIFQGCSDIFFEPLAAAAYAAAYLSAPLQREYRGLGKLAQEFWKANRKEIAQIGRGFWGGYYPTKVYFPHLTAHYIKCRACLIRMIKYILPPRVKRWGRRMLRRE